MIALIAGALCGCTSVAPDASGAEIYSQLCSNCHGSGLEGRVGPALGQSTNAAEQPDEYLETTILRGRGSMPSFSASLTDEQVDMVVAFLREEQAG
jgi:mono/diheme cytochrome c family protein